MLQDMSRNYDYYKTILNNKQKPLAYIDLDYLNYNIKLVLKEAINDKKIRIATKSVRCVKALQYILNQSSKFCGLMTYDGNETLFLLGQGFDNILIGYPLINHIVLEKLCVEIKKGKNICFMVDRKEHVEILNSLALKHEIQLSICLDINLSQAYPFLYFGALRSSIKETKCLHSICKIIKNAHSLKLIGLMGYEAQVAGVGENIKGEFFKNLIKHLLKKISVKKIAQKRKEFSSIIKQNGFKLEFINGGGSGSLHSTKLDPSITEFTIGSAFYAPHFLDSFREFKYYPAAGFALEITRQPSANIFTAHGGGYHSSGIDDHHKAPKVYLPTNLSLIPTESAGEVQTPFLYTGKIPLKIGDTILMRHSKSGEMCERFNQLHFISNGSIVDIVNTYRGDGLCTL